MIEMVDLLAEDHVLQQGRTSRVGLEVILVVGDGDALVRRQPVDTFPRRLMGFATVTRVAIVPACHRSRPFIGSRRRAEEVCNMDATA
jgi:hypothetical protein